MAKQAAEDARSTDDVLMDSIDFEGLGDLMGADVFPPELGEAAAAGGGENGDSSQQSSQNNGDEKDESAGKAPEIEFIEKPPVKEDQQQQQQKADDDLITVDVPTNAAENQQQQDAGGEKGTKEESAKAEEDKSKDGGKAKSDEGNESPMYLHAAALQENGLLPDFDLTAIKELPVEEQYVKINEHIQTTIEKEIKDAREEAIGEIDDLKAMYEDIRKGVPREQLQDNMTLEQQYKGVTDDVLEENVDMQKAVYYNSLVLSGVSDAKAQKLVDNAEKEETLLDDSKEGLKDINAAIKQERIDMRDAAEKAQNDAKEKRTKTIKKVTEVVNATKEIIPGIALTEAEHKQLIKDMTTHSKVIERDGRKIPISRVQEVRMQDPVLFEMRLNYFIQQGWFNKDAAFEKIEKKATTSAANKLLEKMNAKPNVNGEAAAGRPKPKKEEDGLGDDFIFPDEIM